MDNINSKRSGKNKPEQKVNRQLIIKDLDKITEFTKNSVALLKTMISPIKNLDDEIFDIDGIINNIIEITTRFENSIRNIGDVKIQLMNAKCVCNGEMEVEKIGSNFRLKCTVFTCPIQSKEYAYCEELICDWNQFLENRDDNSKHYDGDL